MEQDAKNSNFVQLYRGAIDELTNLSKNQTAYRLFMFLVKHMDGLNALCVSGKALSEFLGLSRQTISLNVKFLRDNGWIDVLKQGTSNVYIVNSDVVWTSYDYQKKYCRFQGNILLSDRESKEWILDRKDADTHFKHIDDSILELLRKEPTEKA